MIKYLGSKRVLIPVLAQIAEATQAQTAVDLFTGTTRVAQAFKKLGIRTTATDIATYSDIFARTYISTDADDVDIAELQGIIDELNALPGQDGYITQEFCTTARYFHPKNGRRMDAIREKIQSDYADTSYYPILLTSLIEAADKVDSTVGLQMAYLKSWAARAHKDMHLEVPLLLPGKGASVLGDAMETVHTLPSMDLAYLDPPYNQHRYFTNYHVWETFVRWDKPQGYGVANKRIDARDESTKSSFNKKREMPLSMRHVITNVKADTVVVSYNNESWVSAEEIYSWMEELGKESVLQLDFDFKRHVGAQIGVYNPQGQKVGTAKATRNVEHIFVAGSNEVIRRISSQLDA